MTDYSKIEQMIRELLHSETGALQLSNRLFHPQHGLFGQLAGSEAERRTVAATQLFRDALRRISEIERIEAEVFRSALTKSSFPDPQSTLQRLEFLESA